jgi:hypothetical protein
VGGNTFPVGQNELLNNKVEHANHNLFSPFSVAGSLSSELNADLRQTIPKKDEVDVNYRN